MANFIKYQGKGSLFIVTLKATDNNQNTYHDKHHIIKKHNLTKENAYNTEVNNLPTISLGLY